MTPAQGDEDENNQQDRQHRARRDRNWCHDCLLYYGCALNYEGRAKSPLAPCYNDYGYDDDDNDDDDEEDGDDDGGNNDGGGNDDKEDDNYDDDHDNHDDDDGDGRGGVLYR